MSSPLPAPSIQRCNYRSAGKNRKPSSTTRFFCIKTAGRGSLKRGSGQHSFGFPRTSEFGLSPHPDYVLKWRKKPCALLDFAQELCLRGSGFAFLRRAAARVGLSGSGASRFPSEKVLKTAQKAAKNQEIRTLYAKFLLCKVCARAQKVSQKAACFSQQLGLSNLLLCGQFVMGYCVTGKQTIHKTGAGTAASAGSLRFCQRKCSGTAAIHKNSINHKIPN